MVSQTAADLRTLVTRRVGLARRVALLASDRSMVQALETNRCTVLVDPASLDELKAFEPNVVVAFDGFFQADPPAALRALTSATSAELVLSFANASSASSMVRALAGKSTVPAFAEPEVRQWLEASGYVVTARDVVVMPAAPSGLSVDTDVALRQLFEQLNPDAAVDRFLITASRGAHATQPDREAGLVSVVVTGDARELEGTVASLLGQMRRPMEFVVVSSSSAADVEALVAKARLRSGVTVVIAPETKGDAATCVNAGLRVATGQYVAFAEAGDLFDSRHLVELVTRLEQGTEAWAVGRTNASLPPSFSLAAWLTRGAASRSAWLVDRERLGRFSLTCAEQIDGFEALAFARLALVFAPAVLPRVTLEKASAQPVDVAAVLSGLGGRPLRGLTTLKDVMDLPRLEEVLQQRLEAVDPRLSNAMERGRSAVEKVRQAWADARKAAKDER